MFANDSITVILAEHVVSESRHLYINYDSAQSLILHGGKPKFITVHKIG